MKLLGYILAGIIVLAIAQLLYAALCVLLLFMLLWTAITHPIEFAAWLGFGLVVALFQLHPLVGIAVCVVGFVTHRCIKAHNKPPVLLLPPPSDPPPE